MLGYEPEDISNDLEEWSRRVHPDDMEKCLVSIHEHLEGKQPFYMNTHRLLCNRITSYNVCYTKLLRCSVPFGRLKIALRLIISVLASWTVG